MIATPPPPSCGVVDVEDHNQTPTGVSAQLVRDAMRQKLAALAACDRPYRIHVDLTVEAVGSDGLRARLRLIIYGNHGSLAGEIPTALSLNHWAPADVASRDALLREGSAQAAELFSRNFQ